MPWVQLIIDSKRDHIESIENALLRVGAVSVTLQEHIPNGQEEQPILEPGLGETPLWDHSRVTGLFTADCDTHKVNQQLLSVLNQTTNSRWEQLEDKDWERCWMDNYHPIQCADKLWICPSWQSPPDPTATNLLLDPGLAFGTGTHPTTFLCMQWLSQQNLDNTKVIDYGCGSGILGICALLLGSKKCTGIDIDPQALVATQENVKRNGLEEDKFLVFLPQQVSKHTLQADLVIANILAGPLVDLAEVLLKPLKPGGKICLSGILKQQAQQVINAYTHYIDFEPIAQKEEWVRLSGYRRQ